MNIFHRKKFRVRAFIQEKDKTWSTHVNKNFNTREEAEQEYNRIYNEWKEWIDKGTFKLEDIWEHQ